MSLNTFQLAEILVLAGAAGAGGMALQTSTRISARQKRVQGHRSRVNVCANPGYSREKLSSEVRHVANPAL